jgi:hypothetical protein
MNRITLAFEQTIDDVTLAGGAFTRTAAAFAMDVKWMPTRAKNKAIERHFPLKISVASPFADVLLRALLGITYYPLAESDRISTEKGYAGAGTRVESPFRRRYA